MTPTKIIADPDKPGDYIVIDESDFDPATMKPFAGKVVEAPAPAPETGAMTREEAAAWLGDRGVEFNQNLGVKALRKLVEDTRAS